MHHQLRLWLTSLISFCISIGSAVFVDRVVTDRIPVLGDFAGIVHTKNPGIAFGISMPPLVQTGLITVALIAITAAALQSAKTKWQQIGFGLIMGGALANVVDRLPDGFVTDFFQVGNFYIFNIADSCISIGVGILLLEILIKRYQGIRG